MNKKSQQKKAELTRSIAHLDAQIDLLQVLLAEKQEERNELSRLLEEKYLRNIEIYKDFFREGC